jgi:HlyD family secretion protein
MNSLFGKRARVRLILSSAVSLCCAACGGDPVEGAATAVLKRGPLVFTASYYGELKPKESEPVFAPIIPEIPWYSFTVVTVLDDGAHVKKDDVVLRLDRAPVEEELFQADTAYRVAEAERKRAEHNLAKEKIDLELQVERCRMNLEKAKLSVAEGVNYRSKLEVEQAKLDVKKAELELTQAEKSLGAFAKKHQTTIEAETVKVDAALKQKTGLEKALVLIDVKAPADGVLYRPLTQLNRTNNERVAPGKSVRGGDKLVEIPDLTVFEANLIVRQREAALISVGDTATVYAAAIPEAPIPARVVRVDSFATTRNERLGTETAEGNLKEIAVVVELAKAPAELRPGGSVRAEIRSILARDAVLVPLAALRGPLRDGVSSVALAGGEIRKIKVGKTTTAFAEALGGVKPGDEVVLGSPPGAVP